MLSFLRFLARFGIAFVLVLAVTGVVYFAGNKKIEDDYEDTPVVDIAADVFTPVDEGEPANFLIIGSDSREVVDNADEEAAFGEVGGQRSDTIMVVHVEPDTETGFVVSFPRDLWVQIPGHGSSKLNAAFGLGGPELVIETLRKNFLIDIHHYLEVDFDGFRDIVNTIGGVDIYFNAPARDRFSQLNIPDAGCRELNGDEALAYTRSRFYEAYDAESDRWRDDPRSDLSRIERQQYFMRSLADSALESGARNVFTAYSLVGEVFDSLKRDEQLELDDIKGLINAFRDLDPASIEMTTLPTEGATRGGASVQLMREEDAAPLLSRLRTFGAPMAALPAPERPADISVLVLNGSGVRGRGNEVLDALVEHGFVEGAPADDADRDDYPVTNVRYAPGAVGKGLTVGAALGTSDVLETREALPEGVDVVVIVGRDWDEVVAPIKEAPVPTSEAQGSDTTATEGTAATTTTPTTRPVSSTDTMFVPVDPETGGALVGCP